MKPHELRLGNLVIYEATYHRVTGIIDDRIISEWLQAKVSDPYNAHMDEYKPIPLTKEWLIKFGFKKGNIYTYSINISPFEGEERLLAFTDDYLYLREKGKKGPLHDDLIILWNKDLKKEFYIHQLQNLFFALTGQELTIATSS
jgi:hypothetical protein